MRELRIGCALHCGKGVNDSAVGCASRLGDGEGVSLVLLLLIACFATGDLFILCCDYWSLL